MTLPTLSGEQREAALAKAKQSRLERAEFKQSIADSTITTAEALNRALENETLGKMRVAEFLVSLPTIGKVKAESLMDDTIKCAHNRRLRGLGDRQIAMLREVCADVDARKAK